MIIVEAADRRMGYLDGKILMIKKIFHYITDIGTFSQVKEKEGSEQTHIDDEEDNTEQWENDTVAQCG